MFGRDPPAVCPLAGAGLVFYLMLTLARWCGGRVPGGEEPSCHDIAGVHDSHSWLTQETQTLMVRVGWGLLGSPPEVTISATHVLSFGKGVSESHPQSRGREFSPTSGGGHGSVLCLRFFCLEALPPSPCPLVIYSFHLFLSEGCQ